MRGRWWGLAVILAATTLAVSAQPTSKASSTSDSVTIPLILRQAAPPKKPEPPKKEEAKSPQEILEEAAPAPTPVAMQSHDTSPAVPLLEQPPAPTLDLPTSPELFVPDLNAPLPAPKAKVAEPKPQPAAKAPTTVAVAPPPPAPKEKPATPVNAEPKPINVATIPATEVKGTPGKRSVSMEPVEDVPNGPYPPRLPAKPRPEPVKPAPLEMQPVEDSKPGALHAAPDGKPPAFRCLVRDVMAFHDRTHVSCYNAVQGKVSYFAVDTNQPVASTVVSKALVAMKSRKPLMIVFAPDADLNPSNCGPKNCRRLIDIEN